MTFLGAACSAGPHIPSAKFIEPMQTTSSRQAYGICHVSVANVCTVVPFNNSKAVYTADTHYSWLHSTKDSFQISRSFNRKLANSTRRHSRCQVSCSAGPTSRSTGQQKDSSGTEDKRAAIEVENLKLSLEAYGMEKPVLKGCTLAVPRGELWMLLGPNGCGKSTLLKALAGLLSPNGGRFRVASPRSFVFQNPDHQVVMPTVGSDVAFGLGRLRIPEPEVWKRVESSLAAVGMADYIQRAVHTLSGGQKQRVAIAGALAEESHVLLLDELTTFLDEADQVGVLEAVRRVVGGSSGVTALWVTHRLEELAFADGAIYMEDGRVVIKGNVKDVRAYIQRQQDKVLRSINR